MRISKSLVTSASPEKVWSILTDVKNWKNWEIWLREADLEGEFGPDAVGVLVPENGPKARFRVTNFKPDFTYTLKARLPFAQLNIRRLIGYHNRKTWLQNEIWMEGPLGRFWWKLLGKDYRQVLSAEMDHVKALAEK
jgi:hypothetical protein